MMKRVLFSFDNKSSRLSLYEPFYITNTRGYHHLCLRSKTNRISSLLGINHVRYLTSVTVKDTKNDLHNANSKKKTKSKSNVQRQIKNEEEYTVSTPKGDKKNTQCELPKTYSSSFVEASWYSWWEKMGFFKPFYRNEVCEPSHSEKHFTLCLPPPNVTGTLHLGHALGGSIQDAIVRWHRMCGDTTLWNPGCDHAGIATQVVVEKELWRTQKKTRHEIGREEFIKAVWNWKNEKGGIIYDQLKTLGCSLDWSRECFTLDSKLSYAVSEAFIRLHEEGLIFRSSKIINWSCSLRSTISDAEVEEFHIDGKTELKVPGYDKPVSFGLLTDFAYPVADSDEKIVVSTTRPETMLGDVAVAVHPDDPRYSHLHGKHVVHPLTQNKMPIIIDDFVKMDFGTGAVKVTPAHDFNDHEIGLRHNLPAINIINDEGLMVNVPKPFEGMRRYDAREIVLSSLKDCGLQHETKNHPMMIPICSRSRDIVEPRLKDQWFVDCKDMAERAAEVVQKKELVLIPDSYEKQWFNKLGRIKDWCISRQLWWGHQIPAYKVKFISGQEQVEHMWFSAHTSHEARLKASRHLGVPSSEIELQQDADVLDTWFSSAIFPFSIFGWPNETKDMQHFYPTNLLETASDIFSVWVMRMVMLGEKLTGQLPFNQVLLHKIVRDRHGRKMSKSLGNIIDPLDVIHGISLQGLQEKLDKSNLSQEEIKKAKKAQSKEYPSGIPGCGADALRFTLCSYNFTGNVDDILEEAEDSACKMLFVKNLPENTNEQYLQSIVSGLVKAKIRSKLGYAHLEFLDEATAEKQKEILEGREINGRKIIVEYVGQKSGRQILAKRYWAEAHSVNVDVNDIEESRKFCNKIWQAFRFCQSHWPAEYWPTPPHCLESGLGPTDHWILSRLSLLVSECNEHFEHHAINKVTESLKRFWKEEFCDIYLEYCKPVLRSEDPASAFVVQAILYTCMHTALRCLSPFMPFLAEELFQRLPRAVADHLPSICVASYPQIEQYPWRSLEVEEQMNKVQKIVTEALSARNTFLFTKTKPHVYIDCSEENLVDALQSHQVALCALSRSSKVTITHGLEPPTGYFPHPVNESCTLYMQVQGLVDEHQIAKMEAQRKKLVDTYSKLLNEAEEDKKIQFKASTYKAHIDRMNKGLSFLQQTGIFMKK